MAGQAPEGSQFDARQFDAKMNELLTAEEQKFFTTYDEVFDSFDAMGLQENLLRGIYAYGFEKLSAIQKRGIVPFTKGLDVIQQAQSGTGKTATFCSGILQQLNYNLLECQALVLAPTRELAQQIEKVMRALGDYLGVKVHACVGGTSIREDQRILSSGVHVVVGTPGRVFDMLRRQSLRSDHIKMFVLDEADEMLSRGFKDQMSGRGRGRGRGIRGRGSSPSPGPSSSTGPSHTPDLDYKTHAMKVTEEGLGGIVNGEIHGLPRLDPEGKWFDDNQVKKLVNQAIKSNFSTFATTWYKASQDQQDRWWQAFRGNVSFELRHEHLVREAFERYAIQRVPGYIYRAHTNPNSRTWMNDDVSRQFEEYIQSDDFKNKSAKKKINRASGSVEEGRIPGTHAMGRRGVLNYARAMDANREDPLSVVDMVTSKKKKKKTGKFVSRKFEKITDVFSSKKTKAQETQPDTPVDESRLYYEAAGGYDKKGRVSGMGSAASMFFDKPATARHSCAETYSPGIITRLTQEMARERQINAETQARLEQLERDKKSQEDRLRRMEEMMTHRFGSMPPESCNPSMNQRRDDDHGPGGGSDMGNVSKPSLAR